MADPFQPKFVDLVRNTTTTIGTGNIVLGAAVAGFNSFASAVQPGDQFYYSVIGVDKPAEREVGRGTMQVNGTILRDPISGAKTNFTNGNKTIALIAAAEWFNGVQQAGGAGSSSSAATRAELAARPTAGGAVMLSEQGREGLFVFDASNLSALVTADTRQAVYIPPTGQTGSTGAWVRKRDGDHLNIDWFGPAADGTSDDSAVFVALRTLASALAVNAGNGIANGPEIRLGNKSYYLASTYDWKACAAIWRGTSGQAMSVPMPFGGPGTIIKMGSGASFIVNRGNTEVGGMGTSISAFGADGSEFNNITFRGPGAGVGTAPVVKLRASAHFRGCSFIQGGSHGLQIEATAGSGGATEGNANGWSIHGGSFLGNGGSGLAIGLVASADVNAGVCVGGNFMGNGRYGIEHAGFLGDQFFGYHMAANVLGPIHQTNLNAACMFMGYIENDYANITLSGHSQISGPGVDHTKLVGGAYFGSDVSGFFTTVNSHVIGTLQVDGGTTFLDTISVPNSKQVVCYEGYFGGTATILRSNAGRASLTGYNFATGFVPLDLHGSEIVLNHGGSERAKTTGTGINITGDVAATGSVTAANLSGTNSGDQTITLTGDVTGSGTGPFAATIGANKVTYAQMQQVSATAKLLGRSSAGAGNVQEVGLAGGLGISGGNIVPGALAPTSVAASGDVTSSGGKMGYATGAGGTVTQATSKSTGVTLNKLCGQVTMNGAALAANTAVSFALANSNLAAGDLLILNHVSGGTAGAYTLNAQCGGGTATVNVRNLTAASLSEAIVIGFAIQKAVTA